MTMLSFKQVESNSKSTVNLFSFLIVWISDTIKTVLLFFQFELKMAVHNAHAKKKNLWSEQLLLLFKEKLVSFSIKPPF